MTTTVLQAGLMVHAIGDEPKVRITTPDTDYMGDNIDPLGMDVGDYLNGPRAVHLFHDHARFPVGKTTALTKSAGGIDASFCWLKTTNPDVQLAREAFEEGVLGASVEFVPVESAPNRAGGLRFAKSRLTGWALTANPANPKCVRLLKSLQRRGTAATEHVLDVEDEITGADHIDERDVAAVMRETLPGLVRDALRRSLHRRTEPFEPIGFDVTPAEVRELMRGALREVIGTIVEEQARAALNHATGRVD